MHHKWRVDYCGPLHNELYHFIRFVRAVSFYFQELINKLEPNAYVT